MATPNKVTATVQIEILHLWQQGKTQGEIASALKLHRTTVTKHLRELHDVQTPESWAGGRLALQRRARPAPVKFEGYPPNPAPLAVMNEASPGEAARFWSYASAPNERGCRLWQGGIKSDGAGTFGRNETAYCVAWRLVYGSIPSGLQVHHRCDVRSCVEPAHLWLGTQPQNLADMRAKNRHATKLTWEIVREIRALREKKGLPLHEIAERFEISKSQASNIVNARQWIESS